MKTVIQVFTNKCINMPQDNYSNYWGLGDMIRGTVYLHQLSIEMGFKFIIDIQLHPISKFLKYKLHPYSDLIRKQKDNILFSHNPRNDILEADNDIIYFFTNGPNIDYNIDGDTKQFIKQIFIPNENFQSYLNDRLSLIQSKKYSIIHYRLGDDYLVNNKIMICDDYLDHFKKHYESTDILISDSVNFKKNIKKYFDIFAYEDDIGHIGYHIDDDLVKNTLVDFFMVSNSSKIKTYSSYGWISGFVNWIHQIYDIELINISS